LPLLGLIAIVFLGGYFLSHVDAGKHPLDAVGGGVAGFFNLLGSLG
jgi:hypothetical protein